MEPGLKVEGEPFSGDFQANEYLRRMAVARGDFQDFLDKRQADAGERGAVVLEFGDHQSSATKPFVEAIAGDDALATPGSLAYRTFYTLTTFNHPCAIRCLTWRRSTSASSAQACSTPPACRCRLSWPISCACATIAAAGSMVARIGPKWTHICAGASIQACCICSRKRRRCMGWRRSNR